MKEYNIIGDIAGRFDELMELVAKMPVGAHFILAGDLMDRGPRSKEVIEWAMRNKANVTALYGNHDDMMVKCCSGSPFADLQNWIYNGGAHTLASYDPNYELTVGELIKKIPKEHIEFLKTNPRYFETDEFFVTHAPFSAESSKLEKAFQINEYHHIWNRNSPKKQDKFQIFGHNSLHKEYRDKDGELFAVCIDNCSKRQLMGMHWPSKRYYSVDYKEME